MLVGALGALGVLGAGLGVAVALAQQVPTTRVDFFEAGTQQLPPDADPLVGATTCSFCHADYDPNAAPFDNWRATMMAQSARDPIFHAALNIANHDAAFAGASCLRCHSPVGFLNGHTGAVDGSELVGEDLEGVSCSACHRMVDPIYTPGVSPAVDQTILAQLDPPADTNPHNGGFVIDPRDRRRGPFDLEADWANTPFMGWPDFHEYEVSPFHTSSRLCASCHDVSLPHLTRQTDGTYALNAMNTPGPSNKYDQFPEQRTYSEWANSLFAQHPVDLNGRFGGTRGEAVASCQDCHMPGVPGAGCGIGDPPLRGAVPKHSFAGANTWVLRAIRDVYFDSETFLDAAAVDAAIARTLDMLASASDLELSRQGNSMVARIVNYTGHKLPTGYPEGRRMWLNVRFLNASGVVVSEHGAYDPVTATLAASTTKVYEAVHEVGPQVAALTGKPVGTKFHLVLNSVRAKDNRIPPMGFTNAAFEAIGAAPVGATYADGQYWDDTAFAIPSGAVRAEVKVYYQTTSKEYAEFLRDALLPAENPPGTLAYNLWLTNGRSEPALMDSAMIELLCPCDTDENGAVEGTDIFVFLDAWFAQNGQTGPDLSADFDGSGSVNATDIFTFLDCWFGQCL